MNRVNIKEAIMKKPHLVILGAGASRAVCPNGDKNGRVLPLMNTLASDINIVDLLERWGIDATMNFEEIFSSLHENNQNEKQICLEEKVREYFLSIEIPDEPTIYDYLLLSLNQKDAIATFNWDPLLVQSVYRLKKRGIELPILIFLHGNVFWGKNNSGDSTYIFNKTQINLIEPCPLIYPIRRKDYSSDYLIEKQWNGVKYILEHAFMITIFGYSGPSTDEEAMNLLSEGWGEPKNRNMEQIEIIDLQSEESIISNFNKFIHSHHYYKYENFFESFIFNHPKRTADAYYDQFLDAQFIKNEPIEFTNDWNKLINQFKRIK